VARYAAEADVMIDELDLAFEDRPERERWRHARRRKPAKKAKKGRSVIAFLLSVVLLGALGGGAWYGYDKISGFFSTPDYDTGGTGAVRVEIKPLDTITEMGNTLFRADVVKSAKAFVEAAGDNPRSENIQPGVYQLRKQMRAKDALAMLLDLKNKLTTKITISEGRTAKQTYDLLAKATNIPAAKFAEVAKDPVKLGVPDFWFKRTDGKKETRSIEGFLYPDTYQFDPNPTPDEILRTMVSHFLKTAEEIKFVPTVEAERGGISPYEALMVASLAQAEAGVPKDLGKIARVAYNRLYTNSPELGCHCLEMDVTINYWLELQGKPTKASKDLTQSELTDAKDPYNTRVLPGLPPTAIDSPGKEALQAAMSPPRGGWIYFVAIDKQGNSAFATTKAEHDKNVQKARENGVL
jgi:UPF0755 protein